MMTMRFVCVCVAVSLGCGAANDGGSRDGAALPDGCGAIDSGGGDSAVLGGPICEAAAGADVETLREEYETTFVGTGKAPITLYTSAYSMRYTNGDM